MEKELEKKLIKKMLLSPIMIGVLVLVLISFVGSTYAAVTYLYDSKDIKYDNTESGIVATNVQGAVDELYAAATDYSSINTKVNGIEDIIGNSTLTTTSETLTGGINELNGQIANVGNSFVPYVDLSSVSSVKGMETAWNALTIYDRPVIVCWNASGKWYGLLYKYSGGQYGMGIAQVYYNNTLLIMSVSGGKKTIKALVGS